MKINPLTLPLRCQLRHDRHMAVAQVRRCHVNESTNPHLNEVQRLHHAIRALRLANWLTWIAEGYEFEPWHLNPLYPFPLRPLHLAGTRFKPQSRRSGRMPPWFVPLLARWQELWPRGRGVTPFRARFNPRAPADVPCADYDPRERTPRERKTTPPATDTNLSVRDVRALLRTTPHRHDGAK